MSVGQVAADYTGRARRASRLVAKASTHAKNRALLAVADALIAEQAAILAANQRDLEAAHLAPAMVDRLRLTAARLADLAGAVRQIAALPDPVGRISGIETQPSGIGVGRMQVPLGTILIVYEARPNVTIDAAALCVKAGNAVILRGGREALNTNQALAALFQRCLVAEGLPADAALFVDDVDRALLYALLQRSGEIDLAIPRGGPSLIAAVNEHAKVPVIQHYQGICHVYVHANADLDVAEAIIVNAKAQRPGVCNALEGILVDAAIAESFLPRIVRALGNVGVAVRGCERTQQLVTAPNLTVATPADFDTEFLALIAACKVVEDMDDALAFIAAHGSFHTESIVTRDHDVAMRFLREVDASCVMVNASTRFNDGGELGLGAELGISTTKLHAYGPMGLEELCTRKFIVFGHGETRGKPPA